MQIFPTKKSRHNAFCAFCRTPRRLSRKRNISFVNVTAAFLVSPVIMWLMWGGLDARVFVIFVCLLGVAEYFVQIRWRLSVICRACGFDPVLYVRSPETAATLVRQKLDERRAGHSILKRPLNLPSITHERSQALAKIQELKKAKPGSLVSRQI